MPKPARAATHFLGKRIQERRTALQLTQMQLGVLAGIDESTASGRVNQYERGKHVPDLTTAERLAVVLDVPLPYLFCPDSQMAELIYFWAKLNTSMRVRVLRLAAGQSTK